MGMHMSVSIFLLFSYYHWVVHHDRPSILVFSIVVGFVKTKESSTFLMLKGLEEVSHCSLANGSPI